MIDYLHCKPGVVGSIPDLQSVGLDFKLLLRAHMTLTVGGALKR